MPASPAGWAVLIGFIIATVAIALLGFEAMRGWHPVATVGVMLPAMTAAIVGFLRWVVIPLGRDAEAP